MYWLDLIPLQCENIGMDLIIYKDIFGKFLMCGYFILMNFNSKMTDYANSRYFLNPNKTQS